MTLPTLRLNFPLCFSDSFFLTSILSIACLLMVSSISTKGKARAFSIALLYDSEKLFSASSHVDVVLKYARLKVSGFLFITPSYTSTLKSFMLAKLMP
ncbi:hypothetical protein BRARA_A02702 [Brassica rapa]|uniref:Uncharacterized protein n=1 Tax=Brassica campestris TaxID=3711 RepID=A0A398AX54_BRACM|nr:hypothetical protein BRARA_A02702 [Brassica rapa]